MKCLLTIFSCLIFLGFAFSQGKKAEIEKLIQRLKTIDEDGIGFSSFYSGAGFLPYPSSMEVHMLVLGQEPVKESGVLTQIVTYGYDAIPILLTHLNDSTPVKIPPKKGMMWIDFPDEYDYNSKASANIPRQVNTTNVFAEHYPKEHQLTIGDFCFVALGQIVNRNFNAARYQPTGGMVINSPTYSSKLYRAIFKEWGALTKEQHRKKLIEDFVNPDHAYRTVGAYQRLAFYYPAEVEKLVLNYLERPTYDRWEVETFVRKMIYGQRNLNKQKELLDGFIKENGAAARDGILNQLFADLNEEEVFARKGYLTQKHFGFSRDVLSTYFGFKSEVTAKEWPKVNAVSDLDYCYLLEALKHDKSEKITQRMMKIFQSSDNGLISSYCTKGLIGRGEGMNLKKFCETQLSEKTLTKTRSIIYQDTIKEIEKELSIKKG